MSTRSPRRAGAAIILSALFVALSGAWAGPAGAKPVITIDSPTDNQVFDTGAVVVKGSVTTDTLFQLKSVTMTIGDQTTTCTDPNCFPWTATLAVNGPYTLTVSAVQTNILLGDATTVETRRLTVAAPPQKPTLDPPRINDDRSVALTWSRNAEPDMLYYAVFRKDPGAGKFLQVGGKVAQPASGAKNVSFTDTTTTFNGGDYSYQVVAVRKGGTTGSEASSNPSAAGKAAVPAPPVTTTTAPPPGSPAAGPTTTAKPGPPAGVDLGGFLSSRSDVRVLPPITVPEPPDTGFKSALPFGARPPGDDLEPGADQPTVPTRSSPSVISDLRGGRPLVPVAAGLVLLLFATHLRLLNRRIKPQARDLPVDLIPAAPGPLAAPADPDPGPAVADPEPEVEPDFFDLEDQAEWDEPWVPIATEPEPEPVLVPARAADDAAAPLSADGWAPLPAEDDDIEAPVVVNGGPPSAVHWDDLEIFEVVTPSRRPVSSSAGR